VLFVRNAWRPYTDVQSAPAHFSQVWSGRQKPWLATTRLNRRAGEQESRRAGEQESRRAGEQVDGLLAF
jgi:hypothetical protein